MQPCHEGTGCRLRLVQAAQVESKLVLFNVRRQVLQMGYHHRRTPLAQRYHRNVASLRFVALRSLLLLRTTDWRAGEELCWVRRD